MEAAMETKNDDSAKSAKVMFWGKIFGAKYELVVAICDQDLIDKVIGSKLKVKVSRNFYGGRLMDEEFAVKIMGKATIGNLMGKSIVDVAKKGGFITKENIIYIDDVPHAQFVKT